MLRSVSEVSTLPPDVKSVITRETLEILKMRKRALKSLLVLMIDKSGLLCLWSALLFVALLL